VEFRFSFSKKFREKIWKKNSAKRDTFEKKNRYIYEMLETTPEYIFQKLDPAAKQAAMLSGDKQGGEELSKKHMRSQTGSYAQWRQTGREELSKKQMRSQTGSYAQWRQTGGGGTE
jgi:hypothetical protein